MALVPFWNSADNMLEITYCQLSQDDVHAVALMRFYVKN